MQSTQQRIEHWTARLQTRAAGLAAAACIGVLMTASGAADALVVDQRNDAIISGGFTLTAQPIGQEFVPTLNAVDFVQLQVNDQSPNNGGAVPIFVRIRDGGILGTILGTSNTVLFPDHTSAIPTELVQFDFASPVALVPGHTYVIDIAGNTTESNLGIFGTGFGNDAYTLGNSFFNGAPFADPSNAPFDLWFREGVQAVPEPGTNALLLAGLGFAVVTAYRRRR